MLKRTSLSIIILFGLVINIFAIDTISLEIKLRHNPDSITNKAIQMYNSNFYEDALKEYSKLISEHNIVNWQIFYNLGNMYYKKKNLSRALWNYYIAYRINPYDDNLKKNINTVQSYILNKEEFDVISSWYFHEKFFSKFSVNTMGIICITLIVLIIIFLIINNLTLKTFLKKRVIKVIFVLLIIVAVFTAGILIWKLYYFKNLKIAVINSEKVLILDKPSKKTGEGVFVINKGSRIRLISNIKDWYLIELPNGLQGWVHREDFIIVSINEGIKFYKENKT